MPSGMELTHGCPHFAPKAKRVIYLFQSGGPSQLDLFDHKPLLTRAERPAIARLRPRRPAAHRHVGAAGVDPARRFASSSSRSTARSGAWLSELLPHTAAIADDLCIVRSMYTEAINHDPAITFFQTGSQLAGRPSHRLLAHLRPRHRERRTCPRSSCSSPPGRRDQPLYARLWGSGFLRLEISGRAVPAAARPGALPHQSRRHLPLRPARDARQARPSSTAISSKRTSIRRSNRASPNTKWPSACRPACPR